MATSTGPPGVAILDAISKLEISVMDACNTSLKAYSDLKALKASLGLKDSSATPTPVPSPVLAASTPYRHASTQPEVTNLYDVVADDQPLELLAALAGEKTTEAESVEHGNSGASSTSPPLDANPMAAQGAETEGGKNKKKKKKSGKKGKGKAKEDEPTEPTPEASSSNHNFNIPEAVYASASSASTTPGAAVASAPSASNLWPESGALKAMGARLAIDIYRTKGCNSHQEARALLEEVWSEARTKLTEHKAEYDAVQVNVSEWWSGILDVAHGHRRSFEDRIGTQNWTTLLELDAACKAEDGDGAATLSDHWKHADTGT